MNRSGSDRHRRLLLCAALCVLGAPGWAQGGGVDDGVRFDPRVISVKFREGLTVRLRDGAPDDLGTGALAPGRDVLARYAAGTWRRTHRIPEAQLERLHANAEARLARPVANLNLYFELVLPAGADPAAAIDALSALACVEHAERVPIPAPPPTPDFQPLQGYLNAATTGVGAIPAWSLPGATGAGVRVADIEYGWNLAHDDFPVVTLLGPPPSSTPWADHGTAVLGILVGLNNGWGVTGISHGATAHVVAALTASGLNIPAAVTTAAASLQAGDVILLEQQMAGPSGWYSPVEWYRPTYDAIVTAVGNGLVVVEAAGNGNANLDHPSYSTGNGGHYPFLAGNNSGAIMVGAGAAPAAFGGSTVDRSRLTFSNYGSRLDVQGWGERVVTAGYGDFYSAEGPDRHYTDKFSGTSSSSAIVAGACALIQSRYKAVAGAPLAPAQLRARLRATGSPQQSGTNPATQTIGPRPNSWAVLFCYSDCNEDGALTVADFGCFQSRFVAGNMYADCTADGVLTVADFGCFQTSFTVGCP